MCCMIHSHRDIERGRVWLFQYRLDLSNYMLRENCESSVEKRWTWSIHSGATHPFLQPFWSRIDSFLNSHLIYQGNMSRASSRRNCFLLHRLLKDLQCNFWFCFLSVIYLGDFVGALTIVWDFMTSLIYPQIGKVIQSLKLSFLRTIHSIRV
jgi:hypothetical protein